MKNVSIYIHIPFCVRKCLYCDFLSFPVSAKAEYREQMNYVNQYNSLSRESMISYVNLLRQEITVETFSDTKRNVYVQT